jgi:formylglycine-generating enzyme required for sulfatase activity
MKVKTFLIILLVLVGLISCKSKSTTSPIPTVPTPVISPAGGTYTESQTVTISCSLTGSEIRYTLDGTDPTQSSTLYQEPFSLSEPTTVKARAFYDGYNESKVVSVTYEFDISIPENFVFVEGGSFSPDGGNYNVTLSTFYMAKYEVTQAEWASVMTGNNNGISATPSDFTGDSNRPVENVSWYDILVYCNRRSIQEGLMPVYAKAGDTNPNNWGAVPEWTTNAEWDAIEMNMSANGYRLPTEPEWEWAARGGVTAQQAGTFNTTYAGSNTIGDVAWYLDNNTPYGTKPVGTKAPNELGLYDMSGNVWEWCWDWCWDWWGSSYPAGSVTNPTGPNSGSNRMFRGGSWHYHALICTVSYRSNGHPYYRSNNIGFRPLRAILD